MRIPEVGAYPGSVRAVWGICAALLGLGACTQAPAPAPAKLWTLFDIEALYAAGATSDHTLAADAGLPGGIPIGRILDGPMLFQRPALVERSGGSYFTTEVWLGYDQVWMQPMYVPVTGWVDGAPQKLLDPSGAWHPVFSVGPGSGFYSPFWQAVYVTVPPGTTTATYTSAKQILDAGLPLSAREGWTIPIVPADIAPPIVAGIAGAVRGRERAGSTAPKCRRSPLASASSTGTRLPMWSTRRRCSSWSPATRTGICRRRIIPTVGGTGPLGSHAGSAPTFDNEPIYASYWRLYTVEIPTTARVVADDDLQQALDAAGLHDLGIAVDPTAVSDTPSIVGRVVLNPTTCTQMDPQAGSFDCTYLDSQPAIEGNIDPGAIQPTEITATCPFVTWQDTGLLTPIIQ